MTSRAARRLALVALAIGVSGCGGDGDTGVEYPPTHGVFDYQLGGTYGRISTPDGESRIDIVVRDSTEEPLVGAYNVCYINGFQTQPGDEAVWLGERADALLLDSAGRPVIDPDWPDEYVLDPSTREQREVILGAVVPLVDACREAGYDAVEIDNLDTWTRFARIDRDGAIALAREYVDAAHQRGLAIAQKNAAEFLGVEIGFDFAIVESCAAYDECGLYACRRPTPGDGPCCSARPPSPSRSGSAPASLRPLVRPAHESHGWWHSS